MSTLEVHVFPWNLEGVRYIIQEAKSDRIIQHRALVNQELCGPVVRARFPKVSSSEVSRLLNCFREVAFTKASDTISIAGWEDDGL